MTEMGTNTIGDSLREQADRNEHLQLYLDEIFAEYGEYPLFVENEAVEGYDTRNVNIMYKTGEKVFAHIHGAVGEETDYIVVEPVLTDEEKEVMRNIKEKMIKYSATVSPPEKEEHFSEYFEELFDGIISGEIVDSSIENILSGGGGIDIEPSDSSYERIKYRLRTEVEDLGPINPLLMDSYNEDIHVIGHEGVHVDHSVFSMLKTSVEWDSRNDLESWIRSIGERIDSPVSDATPIIDSTLPDGSRINIMYSDDVSIQGPSLTIRQGVDEPLTINQITKWGTLSPKLVAYLWLALENDQTIFVVGETASGKTTTLNSILTFIPRDSKIYTAEDTAEVVPPHDAWQQLLTRENSSNEQGNVDMFDLVESALRSRPNYVVVGEVRGPEAQMAFQAAQTGHPVLLTFHASDIRSMIQRMTGEPINVPETFMDNCNIAIFQNRVKQGDDVVRRVTSVQEIEGYDRREEGVLTRQVFSWNPRTDEIEFTGVNNSYIMENKVAELLGYQDTRDIYDEINRREKIVERLIDNDILGYEEVNETYAEIQREGIESIKGIKSTDILKDNER